MIKRSTLIEILILLIAASILIMALLSFNVNAQGLAYTANTTYMPSDNYIPVTDPSDNSAKNFLDTFYHRFQEMLQKHVRGAF